MVPIAMLVLMVDLRRYIRQSSVSSEARGDGDDHVGDVGVGVGGGYGVVVSFCVLAVVWCGGGMVVVHSGSDV